MAVPLYFGVEKAMFQMVAFRIARAPSRALGNLGGGFIGFLRTQQAVVLVASDSGPILAKAKHCGIFDFTLGLDFH